MDAQGSLTGHEFPYEFVPWTVTGGEVCVLCVFQLSHVKPKFPLYDHKRAVDAAHDYQALLPILLRYCAHVRTYHPLDQ